MLNQKMNLNGLGLTTRVMKRDYELECRYAEVTEDLLRRAKDDKNARNTRSGKTFGLWDTNLECDMRDGYFPLLFGKKVGLTSVIAELVSFLRGYDSASDFREMGTKIWDANANVSEGWLNNPARKGEDDLGRIYGVQWTDWKRAGDGAGINQIDALIKGLISDPFERSHLVSAWNVGELHLMALKPCHVMFQCYVDSDYCLHLKMFQRSADWFLGVPFNLASYGFLLLWLCQRTGYSPGKLKIEFGDYHLYANHQEAAKVYLEQRNQMESSPHGGPGQFMVTVAGNKFGDPVNPTMRGCFGVNTSHFAVAGYDPKPAIPAPMAP